MKKDIQAQYIFDMMKRKEPKGFELLYQKYYRMMYGTVYLILKDDDLCEDAIQNVMLKLYRLEENKFPKGHELTWLYTVAKNEALQILRKESKSIDVETVELVERGDIEAFIDKDQFEYMIKSLNDQQKEIVTLKVLGGLTHKEISSLIEKPIGTVQWLYNTAIKKLKVALSAVFGLMVLSGGFASTKLYDYYFVPEAVPELEGLPEIIKTLDKNVFFALGVLGVSLIIFIVLYFFSDKFIKLPTKK